MKRFQLNYTMKFSFSDLVNHHYFTLKCLPSTQPRQLVISNKIRMDANYYSLSEDCFHNSLIYGYKEESHDTLSIYVGSLVSVDWTQYDMDDSLLPVYKKQTKITELDENLIEFEKELSKLTIHMDDYEKALFYSKSVFDVMIYEKGSTNIKTDAKTAFHNKKGVCQDFAHILIGLLRQANIPCRYVAGVMASEKYTHAWVEFFAKGRWYGLDPTNQLLVDDNYVIFARGRDYHDTLVNKGIFYGQNIIQSQTVEISMEEIIDD